LTISPSTKPFRLGRSNSLQPHPASRVGSRVHPGWTADLGREGERRVEGRFSGPCCCSQPARVSLHGTRRGGRPRPPRGAELRGFRRHPKISGRALLARPGPERSRRRASGPTWSEPQHFSRNPRLTPCDGCWREGIISRADHNRRKSL
jgi:hypothetical protein